MILTAPSGMRQKFMEPSSIHWATELSVVPSNLAIWYVLKSLSAIVLSSPACPPRLPPILRHVWIASLCHDSNRSRYPVNTIINSPEVPTDASVLVCSRLYTIFLSVTQRLWGTYSTAADSSRRGLPVPFRGMGLKYPGGSA